MNPRLLRTLLIAASAFLTTAQADHMSPWASGWANIPNAIHNTRIDTRLLDDNNASCDFVRYGTGADTTNRWLTVEAAAVETEQASGHQVAQLAARLDPLPGFLGGGWARCTLFDDEALVSRVLNVNGRLRLIRPASDRISPGSLTFLPLSRLPGGFLFFGCVVHEARTRPHGDPRRDRTDLTQTPERGAATADARAPAGGVGLTPVDAVLGAMAQRVPKHPTWTAQGRSAMLPPFSHR
jgi:hypothetical protein